MMGIVSKYAVDAESKFHRLREFTVQPLPNPPLNGQR
jgi:hypothetical protein